MGTGLYDDGMARLRAGDILEARRLLEEAWRREPDDVPVIHGLARALDLAGERDRAGELLERANALAPTDPGPACDLAMLLLEREEDARVVQVLTPVAGAHPEHPGVNLELAMALAKTEPGRARELLKKVLGASDADAETRRQAEALDRVLAAHAP